MSLSFYSVGPCLVNCREIDSHQHDGVLPATLASIQMDEEARDWAVNSHIIQIGVSYANKKVVDEF